MRWFWYFVLYSFLGFLLEVLFSCLAHTHPDRKCFLVFPLCPVYGVGACAVLLLAPLAGGSRIALFLLGAATCTAAEYVMAAWYERGLGVRFWDYTKLACNLHGRVCLPFSAAWGLLSLVLVYRVHPLVVPLVATIPPAAAAGVLPALLVDATVSGILLYRTKDRACLRQPVPFRRFVIPGPEQ